MCDVLDRVENKGIAIGKTKGEMKKAKETAIYLKTMGMSEGNIAKAVNVRVALIRQWLGTATIQ